MKLLLLILLCIPSVFSADVVTVDPAGVTTIAGTVPASAPVAGEVKIGGGDLQISRSTPATGAQVVRGDDPRLTAVVPPRGIQFFTTNGTFTPPAGVTKVIVRAWGGGGGGGRGGGYSGSSGLNGGGGGFVYAAVSVAPLQQIAVTVGLGGVAATTPGAGTASTFGPLIVANGGGPGISGQNVGGSGTCQEPGAMILQGNTTFSGGNCSIGGSGNPGAGGAKASSQLGSGSLGKPGMPGLIIVEW